MQILRDMARTASEISYVTAASYRFGKTVQKMTIERFLVELSKKMLGIYIRGVIITRTNFQSHNSG